MKWFLTMALMALAACGTSSRGDSSDLDGADAGSNAGNTVNGRVDDLPLVVGSAMARSSSETIEEVRETDGGTELHVVESHWLTVRLNESSATCNPMGELALMRRGLRALDLEVSTTEPAGAPGVGTHEGLASIRVLPATAPCVDGRNKFDRVDRGPASITITSMSPRVRGTFTTTLESGQELSGTFDAPVCSSELSKAVACAE